ncbi:hypothetical protein ABEF95_008705 [Exophiala dermatitidis]
MALAMAARATPPSNPNYDVQFSDATIQGIFKKSLPDVKPEHVSIEHLPSGKSFNNRIYFINLTEPAALTRPEFKINGVESTDSAQTSWATSFVLKVSGLPFGPSKTQNEVACLLLLEKYCPTVPAPKVVAWSDDGNKIKTPSDSRGTRTRSASWVLRLKKATGSGLRNRDVETENNDQLDTKGRGWILMTRVPGRIISREDIMGPTGDAIMIKMAEHVAAWRKNMPPARAVGNLRLIRRFGVPPPSATMYDRGILPGLDVYVEGLIASESSSTALNTTQRYFVHKLKAEVRRLKDNKIYEQNKDFVNKLVSRFIKDTLPKLPIFYRETGEMIFTHYDLSPRNVLVVDTPVGAAVSAVIDLEFGGFFPATEEFANVVENDNQEWPAHQYEVFLATLDRHNALPQSLARVFSGPPSAYLPVIHPDFGGVEFQQAVLLARIAGNIAPWWVKDESGLDQEDLNRELTTAKARVEDAVMRLEQIVLAGKQAKPVAF